MSGFLGKLALVQAGVAVGGPLPLTLVAGGLVTSLLTLYAMATAWSKAFSRAPPPELAGPVGTVLEGEETPLTRVRRAGPPGPRARPEEFPVTRAHGTEGITGRAIVTSATMPPPMLGSATALVALGLSYTVLAGPLSALTRRTAAELLAREPYISAVLGSQR